ncbi:universal stress protein [Variovorax sp. RB2P76]|uniref:universal stress protein n=1 Tax=Variovorax sp. RB2P76 TaxID=3443736 RepID=UPI003F467733
MTPRFILAVTDFSSQGNNALNRAALLSAEHGAALKLAYIGWPGDTGPADAGTRLAHCALQLSQAHGLSVRTAGRLHHSLEDLRPEVTASDLVVWGTAPLRSMRSFFLGQPVEAFIRSAGRPVLVVRRAAQHPYRSLLVAVDFTRTSRSLVDFSFSFSKTASVELFHAVSTANEGKLRHAEVSTRAIKAYRDQCRRHAQDRMFWLTDSFDTRRNRVQSAIAHGDPARQMLVQQERSGSDLIVLGKHPGSTFADLFFGSVAGRLLNYSNGESRRTDVLVVPHGWQPATSPSAASRLPAERPAAHRVRAGAPQAPCGPNPASMRAGV